MEIPVEHSVETTDPITPVTNLPVGVVHHTAPPISISTAEATPIEWSSRARARRFARRGALAVASLLAVAGMYALLVFGELAPAQSGEPGAGSALAAAAPATMPVQVTEGTPTENTGAASDEHGATLDAGPGTPEDLQ